MSVTKVHIPEIVVPGRRLGRHVHHDERSKDYPAEAAPAIISVKHQAWGLPLDQANVGSCTAEACVGALNSAPDASSVLQKTPRNQAAAYKLYGVETKMEGQPWPPNDPGGSGLEVCKAAKSLKWLTKYAHAFGIQHALQALVLRPVIFGVAWFDSFDTPNPQTGVVQLPNTATVRGGHEILGLEIDATQQLIGCKNSWGPAYGLDGTFYVPFHVMEQLLSNQGDCTTLQ